MENNKNQLVTIIQEHQLGETQSKILLDKFTGFFEEASKWEKEASAIVITNESQIEEMAKAREIRLALKEIRVNAEKVRVSLKEGIVRQGKAIDGIANVVKALIVPLEDYLESQEKYIENIKKEKEEKLLQDRTSKLSQYVEDISFYNLKDMSDEAFETLLANSKMIFDKKKEDERIAEEKRIEEEKKKSIYQNRTNLLAPYSAFLEDIILTPDTSDDDFKKMFEKAKINKADYDKKQEEVKKENDRLKKEAEKREADAKKEKELADAKIKALEKEKADKEAQEKKEADEKAEKERQAKLAPEKDKLLAYAETIRTIQAPSDLSKAGLEIVKQVEAKLLAISQEIKIKIKEL